MDINYQEYLDMAIDGIIFYLPKIALALVVFLLGLWVIKILVSALKKVSAKSNMDESLTKFLTSLTSIALKVLLVIIVIGQLGIETTSFIAVLGAAGLAVGFALQGSLSNFAGGVLILIFKPFKVGDFIEGAGHAGSVNAVEVLTTTLKTPDNKTIIIPNGALSNSSITNYSTEPRRRADFVFGIGYDDDFEKAKGIIKALVDKDERILKDPEPFFRVGNLGDSSVDITVRVWVESTNYWAVHFDMIENVKKEFDNNSISIPYPQMDIHQYKAN